MQKHTSQNLFPHMSSSSIAQYMLCIQIMRWDFHSKYGVKTLNLVFTKTILTIHEYTLHYTYMIHFLHVIPACTFNMFMMRMCTDTHGCIMRINVCSVGIHIHILYKIKCMNELNWFISTSSNKMKLTSGICVYCRNIYWYNFL